MAWFKEQGLVGAGARRASSPSPIVVATLWLLGALDCAGELVGVEHMAE